MTKLTAGPARATASSWLGCSGILSSRATPPIGRSVMSWVATPNFLAASACPSSCSNTQTKTASTNRTPVTAVCRLSPSRKWTKTTQPIRSRNVQCTKMPIPATRPSCCDHLIVCLLETVCLNVRPIARPRLCLCHVIWLAREAVHSTGRCSLGIAAVAVPHRPSADETPRTSFFRIRSSATSSAPIIGPRNTPRIPKYRIPPKTHTRARRGCNRAAPFKTHTRMRVSTCETTRPP